MKTLAALLLAVALLASARGEEAAYRLAVVSAEETPFVGLLEASLSKSPSLVLVERKELSKLVDEKRISSFIAERKFAALGNLLGAEGLLVLEKLKLPKGGEELTARLISVRNGACLFFEIVPKETKPEEWAEGFAKQVPRFLPGARLSAGEALPVALVGLRASLASADGIVREAALARLLEMRLGSTPGVLLLDRRRMADVQFERSLGASDLPPLTASAVLIDGSVEDAGNQQPVKVSLRLRGRDGAGLGEVVAKRPPDAMAELVDTLAAGVLEKLKVPVPETFTALEREEFLDEAIWAFRAGVFERGAEALAAARALGENSPDALALDAFFMLDRARPRDFYWGIKSAKSSPPKPEEQVELLTEVFDRLAEYRAMKGEPKRVDGFLQNILRHYRILFEAIGRSSEFLNENDSSARPLDVTALRNRVKAAAEMRIDVDWLPYTIGMSASFAKDWAGDADELLKYYEKLLRGKHERYDELIKNLPRTAKAALGPRFAKDPAAVSAWDAMWKRLLNDKATRARALLILSGRAENKEREELYRQYLRELSENVVPLAQEKKLTSLLQGDQTGRGSGKRFQVERTAAFLALCKGLPGFEDALFYFVDGLPFAPGTEQAAWDAFEAYRERCLSASEGTDQADRTARRLGEWSSLIRENNPDIRPSAPAKGLVVSQFWHPYVSPDAKWKGTFGFGALRPEGNSLWMIASGLTTGCDVYEFDLSTGEPRRLPLDGLDYGCNLAVDAKDIWVLQGVGRSTAIPEPRTLVRWNRETGEVTKFPLPDGDTLELAGGHVLVRYDRAFGAGGAGLMFVDSRSGEISTIISSRRNPPESLFDDCKGMTISGVGLGPEQQAYVVVSGEREGIYKIGDAGVRFDSTLVPEVLHYGDLTLLAGVKGEAILLDPDAPEPIWWMATLESDEAVKAKARWRTPRAKMDLRFELASFRKDELFYLERSSAGQLHLRWWFENGPREGLKIPLTFSLSPSKKAMLEDFKKNIAMKSRYADGWSDPNEVNSTYNITATAEGVALHKHQDGFWFIPNADLEAWKSQNSGTALAPEKLSTETLKPPATAE